MSTQPANNQNTKKKKQTLIYKPYKRGEWKGKTTAKRGLKILGYYLIFAFLYIILGASLQFDSAVLRWGSNLLLVAACMALTYMEGARQGETDVALGEIVWEREKQGKNIDRQDLANCYHPLKSVFVFFVGSALVLVITVLYAILATKQVYNLQGLPSWVAGYTGHDEITLPLSYYSQESAMQLVDVLRIIVRVLVFPFANIATADNADALLTVDRLSPILACLPAMGYILGYLTGPRSRAMVHGNIAVSNKRHVKKQRRAAQERRAAAAKRAAEKRQII